jgi:hypothetical protein
MVALLLTFLLGVGNFAVHKAVLESRHPLLSRMPVLVLGGRASLLAEFIVLLGALLLVGNGYAGWALAYLCYSGLNALAAWLILSRRI